MRVLSWQWGRRGAGPQIALGFSAAFAEQPGVEALISLSRQAEIMQGDSAPFCDLPLDTYENISGLTSRLFSAPRQIGRLVRHLETLRPDFALCAMPAPLDLIMHLALRRCRIPYALVIHDAEPHPGDGYPMQMRLQRAMLKRADAVVALSQHVASSLERQGALGSRRLIMTSLPPLLTLGEMPPIRRHGGRLRLLSFGRLLPYKGLDLLAASVAPLMPGGEIELRVVGSGPESDDLNRLRAMPNVAVENRWVAQEEVPSLLAWADALVLSHREASQSGVAVIAEAAGRDIVATNVGGLREQLAGKPRAILCAPDELSLREALTALLALGPPPQRPTHASEFGACAARLLADLSASFKLRAQSNSRSDQIA